MKEAILDPNGVIISYFGARNDQIKAQLDPILDQLLEERAIDPKTNVKYRFYIQLDNILRTYGMMNGDEVVAIDYAEIEDAWNAFRDLIAYYNLRIEVVANKQLFCAFMRINNRIYTQLETSRDDTICNLMASINDSFISLAFVAGETGGANSKAVDSRLRAHNVGHDVTTAAEDKFIASNTQKTPQELQREMLSVLGELDDLKKIPQKNKNTH